ncbi:RHS repeat domain-containing protein [Delftia sp. JD2]|uniref:RHS repeat domain-containing protein n=1 Tax=Delftia sp. JD2 TaxID=469553 RepID=UPI000AC75805|nr:RHS repeat-associated core domain-containing protein [Delftia sp. JD2]
MKNAIRQSCRRLLAAAALLLAALLTTPGALAQATVTYFHNDAAGTPWLATNQSGAVLWKENYLPYGYRQKVEPASADNKLWFAGRPYDPDTGMTYMGARYYMPLLGRFTGMDPKEMNPEQIHSFNRYAYANNNPNKYLDPDGKLAETVWDAFNISIGFQSLVSNVREGNWSGAAVDAAGIAIDGVAAAIPVVPGGVGASIAAYRSIDSAKDGTLIYRSASGTPNSMTPRTVDVQGLSATNSIEKSLPGKIQVINTAKFKNLCAVCDNPQTGHVSIKPIDMNQMQGWIDSRGSNSMHPLTQELLDSVEGVMRK